MSEQVSEIEAPETLKYTCGTCDLMFHEAPADVQVSIAVIAAGDPVPSGGVFVVHVCPNLQSTEAMVRPRGVLDWSDEMERAAVAHVLPGWKLAVSDQIVVMQWRDPGLGRPDATSAPLTVQVRRHGADLKYAVRGADWDEVELSEDEAVELHAVVVG
jgi:hypothetical protein